MQVEDLTITLEEDGRVHGTCPNTRCMLNDDGTSTLSEFTGRRRAHANTPHAHPHPTLCKPHTGSCPPRGCWSSSRSLRATPWCAWRARHHQRDDMRVVAPTLYACRVCVTCTHVSLHMLDAVVVSQFSSEDDFGTYSGKLQAPATRSVPVASLVVALDMVLLPTSEWVHVHCASTMLNVL